MILNRLGNKEKLATRIIRLFPKHEIYMEPFFGAGGVYFKKPKVKYNFLNDLDDDVYNLFRQVIDNKDELVEWIKRTPITETQFTEWKRGKQESTPLLQAIRFLIISNYGFFGTPTSLRVGPVNPRNIILEEMDRVFHLIADVYFLHCDFREFLRKCDYRQHKAKTFLYADPPYLTTGSNYSNGFTEKDSMDLFNMLDASGIKWAMSEFEHPFIVEQVKQRGLNLIRIGDRRNLHNSRTEILITNYKNNVTLFNTF